MKLCVQSVKILARVVSVSDVSVIKRRKKNEKETYADERELLRAKAIISHAIFQTPRLPRLSGLGLLEKFAPSQKEK